MNRQSAVKWRKTDVFNHTARDDKLFYRNFSPQKNWESSAFKSLFFADSFEKSHEKNLFTIATMVRKLISIKWTQILNQFQNKQKTKRNF